MKQVLVWLFGAAGLPSCIAAQPMIAVDAVEFNADTVVQGKVPFIRYTFTIKIPERRN